jgi:replication initiation protein RepC
LGYELTVPDVASARREPPKVGRVFKLAPDELVKLAPQLKSYLPGPDPTWPRVVDAAAFLRADLDVSKSLWGEACLAMGREKAAIAIVSTKDPAHFRTSAGGYFHGMVTKAKAGHLNLDRTLWGMRRANEPRPSGKAGRGAGRGGDARSTTGPRH